MTSRTILTAAVLAGAGLSSLASAQVTYSATFDNPPYTAGATLVGQEAWAAGNAGTTAYPTRVLVDTTSPFAGNGMLVTTSWDSAAGAASSFSCDQLTNVSTAFANAITAGASNVDTTFQFRLPAVSTGPSAHFIGVFAAPAAGSTSLRYQGGLQVYAGPYTSGTFAVSAGEVTMLQWLEPPTVATAGNYQIKFATPAILTPGQWTQMTIRWNPSENRPYFKVGGGDFVQGYVSSTAGALVNNRIRMGCSPILTTNNISSQGNWDELSVVGVYPAYPQCTPAAGACDQVHAGGGCNIVSCCEQVCAILESCCATGWDSSCVGIAIPQCNLFVYSCTNPGTPSNNCATSPTVLSSLPTTQPYDTTLATTDGPPEAGCNSGNSDLPIHKDVWYRFQAAGNGTLIASNCGTSTFGGSGNFDSKIALYDLGPNLATFDPQLLPEYFVSCNEDCNDPIFTSELSASGIVAGNHYLVRLGGYEGQSGTGSIYIGIVPPPNPCDPANIINGVAGINTVTADSLYPGLTTTTCAFPFGTQVIAKAKYIKFTPAASGLITFQTCSDTSSAATDARQAAMTVCGDASTIIACDDDGCDTGGGTIFTSKLQFNVTAGTTYYVAVGGYDAAWTGSNVEIIPPTAPACPADLNNDGLVNGADLGLLLGAWGPCSGCAADLNADGLVNGADLGLLLGAWGPCA
jgi:hypothetical protein